MQINLDELFNIKTEPGSTTQGDKKVFHFSQASTSLGFEEFIRNAHNDQHLYDQSPRSRYDHLQRSTRPQEIQRVLQSDRNMRGTYNYYKQTRLQFQETEEDVIEEKLQEFDGCSSKRPPFQRVKELSKKQTEELVNRLSQPHKNKGLHHSQTDLLKNLTQEIQREKIYKERTWTQDVSFGKHPKENKKHKDEDSQNNSQIHSNSNSKKSSNKNSNRNSKRNSKRNSNRTITMETPHERLYLDYLSREFKSKEKQEQIHKELELSKSQRFVYENPKYIEKYRKFYERLEDEIEAREKRQRFYDEKVVIDGKVHKFEPNISQSQRTFLWTKTKPSIQVKEQSGRVRGRWELMGQKDRALVKGTLGGSLESCRDTEMVLNRSLEIVSQKNEKFVERIIHLFNHNGYFQVTVDAIERLEPFEFELLFPLIESMENDEKCYIHKFEEKLRKYIEVLYLLFLESTKPRKTIFEKFFEGI